MREGASIFNKNSLALLGILDETKSLYDEVFDIITEALTDSAKDLHSVLSGQARLSMACKTALNRYFTKSSIANIFSSEHYELFIDDKVLACARFFDIIRTKPLTLRYSIVSFESFIEEIHFLACMTLLCKRTKGSIDYIHSQVNRHIEQLIKSAREKYVIYSSIGESSIMHKAKAKTIWIYDRFSNLKCNRESHLIINTTLSTELIDRPVLIDIPVFFCDICQRYFIGRLTLEVFIEEYGRLLLRTQRIAEEYDLSDRARSFRAESELHCWGYNVVDGKMSQVDRRGLLVCLLEKQKMTKFGILRDIKNAIDIFQNRVGYEKALAKWRSDFEFVSRLDMPASQGLGNLCKRKQSGQRYCLLLWRFG